MSLTKLSVRSTSFRRKRTGINSIRLFVVRGPVRFAQPSLQFIPILLKFFKCLLCWPEDVRVFLPHQPPQFRLRRKARGHSLLFFFCGRIYSIEWVARDSVHHCVRISYRFETLQVLFSCSEDVHVGFI